MYTSFDGDVVEKIFASDKDDIGNVTNSFNLEKNIAREISRTPEDYITNHPKKTASKAIAENANTKYEVKAFHTFYIDFSSDIFNEYYSLGTTCILWKLNIDSEEKKAMLNFFSSNYIRP